MSRIVEMPRDDSGTWGGRRLPYDAFLREAPEGRWLEWVDGEVLELSPASTRHQRIVGFLSALLQHFAEARRPGIVLLAPFQMKTGPQLPGREPDLLYLASEHRDRLKDNHLAGPADLVVEVISPDSESRDRVAKLREYQEGGVAEYWLIDPERQEALVHVLGPDGRYRTQPAEAGVLHSSVLGGLWIRPEWLWAEPPPLLSVLKAWKLI
jgi:Uma2 family endonuclease